MKTLVIVESPSKAHKIQEYLGKDYTVLASYGHVDDLASGGKFGMGIDIEHDFKPRFVLSPDKIEVMDKIINEAKKADLVLLFSDNDREGTAIAQSIKNRLEGIKAPIKRGVFNEITKKAILKAIKEAGDIDQNTVNSQRARRILDRIVGFTASPFLMNFFGSGLSAGRVQSVVTEMIIDREREIETFQPEDYWTIQVSLNDGQDSFQAKYMGKLTDQQTADATKIALNTPNYVISNITAQEEKRLPQPPLVTSTLQRLMSKKHGFSAEKTLKCAQSLYESGYITYLRTDSVRISDEALQDVRQWLTDNNHTIPKKPNVYKNKDAAQDAHECIRPTDLTISPTDNYAVAEPDQKLTYKAIWEYFVASQMLPALYNTLNVVAHPKNDPKLKVKASGKSLKFKGWMDILGIEDNSSINIPNLTLKQNVKLDKNGVKLEHKQTQPPPRFSEDKLIKEMVNRSIGRPATFDTLLSKVTSRNYVEKRGNIFHATDLGKKITDELNKHFTFMDYDYTAKMEQQLDEIESGKINHVDMLKKFYSGYKVELNKAYVSHGAHMCSACNSPMVIRKNKKDGSQFESCSNFPTCKTTASLTI